MAQTIKNLPAMWETWVWSLGWEDPLNNSYPLQYSCLENSMDKRAWQATVHGVAKSRHDSCSYPTLDLVKILVVYTLIASYNLNTSLYSN